MPSKRKGNKAGTRKSSKPDMSTSWSDWVTTNDGQVYKSRYDPNGQPQYIFQETPSDLSQTLIPSTSHTDIRTAGQYATGYDREYLTSEPEKHLEHRTTQAPASIHRSERDEIDFGSNDCTCGAECDAGSGCCGETTFGGKDPQKIYVPREDQTAQRGQSSRSSASAPDISRSHPHEDLEEYSTSRAGYSTLSNYLQTYAWDSSTSPQQTQYGDGFAGAGEGFSASFTGLDIGQRSYTPVTWPIESNPESGSESDHRLDFEIQDTSPTSDHGVLFGQICEEMGLLQESYGSGHQSNETFASFWNPQRLKNNCILVSVGYLLGINAEQLSDLLNVKLPHHIKGLGVGEMELILGGVPGCHPVIFPFDQHIKSRKSYSPQNQQDKAMRILGPWIRKNRNQPFAIGYQRANKTGHCVVAKPSQTRKVDDIRSHTFWCYQTRTRGVDMTKDIRKSFIRFAIFIDPEKPTMKMDFFYGTTVPGSVSHVQIVEDGWYPAATTTASAYAPVSAY